MFRLSGQIQSESSGGEPVRAKRSFFRRLLGLGLRSTFRAESIENRNRARVAVQANATMTELNARGMPGRSWPVEVLDLSKGGAAFATAMFVAPGTPVIIQFAAGADGPGRSIMATTRHIRRLNELEFAVGVRFEASRQPRSGQRVEIIDAA